MSTLDITSPSNPKIQWARGLHQAKNRRANNVTLVEGLQEINYALEAGLYLETLFYAPEVVELHNLPTADQVFTISKICFERIAYRDGTGGVVGVFTRQEKKLADFKLSKSPFILILEAVEKPGNLGAIIRVADGAGADGVIVCDERTDIWNPNAIRASVGTIFSTQLAVASSNEAAVFLGRNNVRIFAAEVMPSATKYTEINFKTPSAIILGTEASSVSDFWLKRAASISLPMKGRNSSLNVSTAAAVLAYEVLRQREG